MREFSVPVSYSIPDDLTCAEVLYKNAVEDPHYIAFRRRISGGPWTDVTAGEFVEQVKAIAKGLIADGIQAGDRVALMSSTRYEWQLLDFAIWSAGAVTVPVYESSSAEQIQWILQDSAATAIVVEAPHHFAAASSVRDTAPALKHIYQIERDVDHMQGATDLLAERGADVSDSEIERRLAATSADDPATLIYTSGTTGRPKGCALTHRNFLAESRSVLATTFVSLMRPGRRTLMFLPLAHVLARTITFAAIEAKVIIGHHGDVSTLVEQFGDFKPHFILSVPRVFEKVFNTARATAHSAGSFEAKVFDAATETAIAWSKAEAAGGAGVMLSLKRKLFDKLVFSKLKHALGGECEIAISGGAPLGDRLGHFFNGLGLTIYEGYGLTETSAAITVNTIGNLKIGSVGKPLDGATVKIAEDGEILLKGPMVFGEYWENEQATDDSIIDGWFHSGDLGSLDEDGYLSITGRKKEIIVTAGGKNVAPAGLEDRLRSNPLISQAMCVGDQKPFIGVLVTIDPEAFPKWKEQNGKPESATVADLIRDPDLVTEIDLAVKDANTLVSKAEGIKKFRILPSDFSEETGEMTPTMKIKRNVVQDKWADEIDAIYSR